MHLTINGEPHRVAEADGPTPLDQLLAMLGVSSVAVAVLHNGSVVGRERFAQTLIQNGDRLEIVRFVGGG
jgi:thiamine biosynthesis protein ThiS